MLISYLRQTCLFLFMSLLTTVLHADVYKWVDENGRTHYSQQAPTGQEADLIKPPPPPKVDPNIAQQEIDKLIEQQRANEQVRLEQQQKQQQLGKYCDSVKYNLQQYLNNPDRRFIDAEGNVSRLTEEQRQQKINDLKQKISEYCQ